MSKFLRLHDRDKTLRLSVAQPTTPMANSMPGVAGGCWTAPFNSSRSPGVGDRNIRRRRPLAFICHSSRYRSIPLAPITTEQDYGGPPSTRPARTPQSTICCLVRNPSFFCTPDTELRTVKALLFLISPISW